jgi:hypothetical protein
MEEPIGKPTLDDDWLGTHRTQVKTCANIMEELLVARHITSFPIPV